MIKYTFFLIFSICILFSTEAQSLKGLKNKALNLKNNLKNTPKKVPSISEDEAAKALREALNNGINNSVEIVSKVDGYLQSPEIKIPFPPDAKKIEDRLRSLGMNKLVDDAILYINRAAEDAATEAKPIIVQAIKNMTVRDAINIVKGEDNEATNYLKKNTFDSLYKKFIPPIQTSLEKVNEVHEYVYDNIYSSDRIKNLIDTKKIDHYETNFLKIFKSFLNTKYLCEFLTNYCENN